jgi:hypothetical protein
MTVPRADDDEFMLAAYNATLERASLMLKEMFGCDDVKQATPEQINAVVAIILAPHVGKKLTVKQIMRDHRKLSRLKRKQVS